MISRFFRATLASSLIANELELGRAVMRLICMNAVSSLAHDGLTSCALPGYLDLRRSLESGAYQIAIARRVVCAQCSVPSPNVTCLGTSGFVHASEGNVELERSRAARQNVAGRRAIFTFNKISLTIIGRQWTSQRLASARGLR